MAWPQAVKSQSNGMTAALQDVAINFANCRQTLVFASVANDNGYNRSERRHG